MTPHHHRWVKGKWYCGACESTLGPGLHCWKRGVCCVSRSKHKGCYMARCAYHDPRRPPTPAEREERRVLLNLIGWHNPGLRCPCDEQRSVSCPRRTWAKTADEIGSGLSRILESAAYSWTWGPR